MNILAQAGVPLPPPPGIEEWRDGQADIVADALDLFGQYRLVMLDLPTGTGKGPLAAGIAHNLGGTNTYTATTKLLQRAIEETIEGSARLVGRGNYPSFYYPHLACDRCAERSLCPDPKRHDDVEECRYKLAKAEAVAAPLAVLNTHYLIAEANHVGAFSGRDLLVLDEGEQVEDVIRSTATVHIGSGRIDKLGLEPPRDGAGTGEVLAWVIEDLRPELAEAVVRYRNALAANPASEAIARDLAAFERLQNAIDVQVQGSGDHLVGFVTDDGAVVVEPILAAPFGRLLLWRHAQRFLLASGSLIDPNLVAAELGWTEPFGVVSRPSPFLPESRRVIYRPVGSMSRDNERRTMPAMVAAVREILAAHPTDRGLIHAVSYDRGRRLAEALDDSRVVLAGRQGGSALRDDGDRPDVDLDRFRATPAAVLISARHERGVSLDDDLCRFVICVKKPLASWGDPRVRARNALEDGRYWYLGVEPARRLLQMTGRGTRHAGDWCSSYLLDSDVGPLLRSDLFPKWWRAAVEWPAAAA